MLQHLSVLDIVSLSINNIIDPANVRTSKLHEFVSPERAELFLQNQIFIQPDDFLTLYTYVNKYRSLTIRNCKLSMTALQVIVDSAHYSSLVERLELD